MEASIYLEHWQKKTETVDGFTKEQANKLKEYINRNHYLFSLFMTEKVVLQTLAQVHTESH